MLKSSFLYKFKLLWYILMETSEIIRNERVEVLLGKIFDSYIGAFLHGFQSFYERYLPDHPEDVEVVGLVERKLDEYAMKTRFTPLDEAIKGMVREVVFDSLSDPDERGKSV